MSETLRKDPGADRAVAFPHLTWFADELGIRADALVDIFVIENTFHSRILTTRSPAERRRQYNDLYNEVHRIKAAGGVGDSFRETPATYARMVLTFRREMEGKSVLDIGCGNGQFLRQLAGAMPHDRLCGIDTSDVHLPHDDHRIEFLRRDIVDFELEDRFDVAFSHQVLEHIAPDDVPTHLRSVRAALKAEGKFIVILPNRYWGPQDITRIIDNTFSGRVPATGSHLNESSYSELVPQLEAHGFRHIETILPFAAYLAGLRAVRVSPALNQLLERRSVLRRLANMVRAGGRPVFKNPVILICDRQA